VRGLEAAPGRALPMGLVLGGSLGNVLDRIRAGGVTDFIDLRVWPVFNLADVAITVGIGLLAIGLIRRR
jgi:signal peptidase II